ncbi:MAG: apolipoprotein N-acyltransferase [Bacteroidales bacterium]|nr:apolipoprotein N-acyltransferase [Bacteroidales bacterium]
MKKYRLTIYALISGILLSPAWFEWGTGLILLFALTPLLTIEDYLFQNKATQRPHKAFLYAALSFATFNTLTTWWIWNASPVGMLLAILINTLLMSVIFWLFHLVRRNAGSGPGYLGLIVFWLVYEHYYMNGEITWPWLNLGNGFFNDIHLIQWYEFTGAFGGTFWVLLSNILLFFLLKHFISHRSLKGKYLLAGIWGSLVVVPIVISIVMFYSYEEKSAPKEIVVIQPNIDPYNEKFGGMEADKQMSILLHLADSLTTRQTDYVVVPETFISNNVWEDNLRRNPSILSIRGFVRTYPNVKFIVGLIYRTRYDTPEEITKTAQPIPGTGFFYDSFNAALQIDSTQHIPIYKKSKLVVGVEKMPYPHLFGFLRDIMLRLGGTFRSHGTQDYRECFFSSEDSTGVGTAICYESVFGEFVTEYIHAGANYIFVVTNDGWWGDTPGYRQHHAFSRLRAIETRRSVARSANTGTSSFINQRGEVLQKTGYWVPDVIRATLNANDKITFYVKHGDFLARWAYFFSLLVILYTVVRAILGRKKKSESRIQKSEGV